jgi:surface polysaccharide O-acyltransferase-like enzyme
MEMGSVNFLSVIVAAIAYMALGALWYSPVLFGNAWMKGIGKTKEQVAAGASPMNYVLALIYSFIAAYGIARLMIWTGRSTISDGIVIGLLAGICFVLSTMGVNDLFENRPRSLTFVNILYHIVGFIVVGVIVGAW